MPGKYRNNRYMMILKLFGAVALPWQRADKWEHFLPEPQAVVKRNQPDHTGVFGVMSYILC